MKKDSQQNIINIEVGNRIKGMRKKRGYNQTQLASGIGLTRTSICNIETGRQSVTVETLMKLCAVLKCRYKDILPIEPTAVVKELTKVVKVKTVEQKLLDVNFKF